MGCPNHLPAPDNDRHAGTALPDILADANALGEFMAEAAPGTCIGYHIGALARDRYPGLSQLPNQQRLELSVLADYALRLADAGWAHLAQRRLGEERFLYLLVVRPRRRRDSAQALPSLPVIIVTEAA